MLGNVGQGVSINLIPSHMGITVQAKDSIEIINGVGLLLHGVLLLGLLGETLVVWELIND